MIIVDSGLLFLGHPVIVNDNRNYNSWQTGTNNGTVCLTMITVHRRLCFVHINGQTLYVLSTKLNGGNGGILYNKE